MALWAKLWTDILGDQKLKRAARKGAKHLVVLPWLLAFAKANDPENRGRLLIDGEPADPEDIADLLPGVKAAAVAGCLAELRAIGVLVEDEDGVLRFAQWEKRSGGKRQPSASPERVAERVRAHRARKRGGNDLGNAVTPPVTDAGNGGETSECNGTELRAIELRDTEQTATATPAAAAAAADSSGDAPSEPLDEPLTVRRVAVVLTVAGNQGAAEKWGRLSDRSSGEAMPRWTASQAGSIELAERVLAEGIPLDFAKSALRTLCLDAKGDQPPHSLKYFTAPLLEAWAREQARRAMLDTPAPDVIPLRTKGDRYAVFDQLIAAERAKRAGVVS